MECRRMWMRINGLDASVGDMPSEQQTESMNNYLENAFGGKKEVVEKQWQR